MNQFGSWSEDKSLRVLHFDIEARPLAWINQDYVSKEITAIAVRWADEKKTDYWLLGKHDPVEMLEGFRELYDEAGIVTGHYIRGYDLSMINGAMVEYNLPFLEDKMTHDTKGDLIGFTGVSKSQENLCAMLGIAAPKVSMSQAMWRESNRLTPEGLLYTAKRAVGDVNQHVEMRNKMLELKMLELPRMWYSAMKQNPIDRS